MSTNGLDLLKKEMEGENEVRYKVNAIHRLSLVIKSLGPEETVK